MTTDIKELMQTLSIERIKEIASGATPVMGEKERLAITALYFAQQHQIAVDALQDAGRSLKYAEEALEAKDAECKHLSDELRGATALVTLMKIDARELVREAEAKDARIASQQHEISSLLSALEIRSARNMELKSQRDELQSRAEAAESRAVIVTLPDNCEHDVIAPVSAFMYEAGFEIDTGDYNSLAGRVRSEIETVFRRIFRAAGIQIQGGE